MEANLSFKFVPRREGTTLYGLQSVRKARRTMKEASGYVFKSVSRRLFSGRQHRQEKPRGSKWTFHTTVLVRLLFRPQRASKGALYRANPRLLAGVGKKQVQTETEQNPTRLENAPHTLHPPSTRTLGLAAVGAALPASFVWMFFYIWKLCRVFSI